MISSAWLAWATTPAAAAVIAYLLWRGGLSGRLFLEALALGVTMGATIGVAEAPFDLKANPLHFAPQTIAFLFAGLPEEGIKMLGVAAFLRGHWLARQRRDVMLAAGALALGFSVLENVFYLANARVGWAALGVERALTATPFHVFEGLAGGFVIASVRGNPAGVLLALAGWIGLAAVHGLYDFSVFAGAAGAELPASLQHALTALGIDFAVALKATLAGAEMLAALLASGALIALRNPAPTFSHQNRFARFARSRWAGWIFGFLLMAAATVALMGAVFTAFLLDSSDPFFAIALLAAAPLTLGLLFLVFPKQPSGRALSRRGRRTLGGFAVLASVALVATAVIWGPAEWGSLNALKYEARGARFAARGDYASAIDAYGRALAVAPDRVSALSQRAAAYAASGNFAPALADIDHALRVSPDLIALYVQRAEIDRQRDDPASALVDLGPALRLKPDNAELLARRGQARLEVGDRAGAYDDLSAAKRAAPEDPLVLKTFAAWSVDAGDFDAALRDLNARLHADPNDAEAAFQRGRVWLYKGDAARAAADLAHADRNRGFLYPALWRFLAEARLREDGSTDLGRRLAFANDKWPAPVARMFLGLIDLAAAKASAASADDRCEADFYDAALRAGVASADEVAPLFRAAMKECPTGFIEYEGAKAELRRLGQ